MSPLGRAWSVSRMSLFGAGSALHQPASLLLAFCLAVSIVVFAAPARAAAPETPVPVGPGDTTTGAAISPTLEVTVSDSDGDAMDVTFYGRRAGEPLPGPDFTIIAVPDTQHYTDNDGLNAAHFAAQTQWIVDNMDDLNIAFVTGLGDIVQNGDSTTSQWEIADAAYATIEDDEATGLAHGIPYGLAVGNHDQIGGTTNYNTYFGFNRFRGRTYFGGRQSTGNFNNHYELFSVGDMDFMVFHLEYDTSPDAAVLDWADAEIAAHPNRSVIVSTHYLMNIGNSGSFGTQGQAIFTALSDNENVFMMLGGHMHGEGQRQDTGSNGNVIHSLLSDYQDLANGGNGWLRIMEFSPANDEITVATYSPVLDQYGTDATMGDDTTSAPFTLPYDMLGDSWVEIGTDTGVATGSNASIVWPDRDGFAEYEWYAVADDGTGEATTGPTWTFTTGEVPVPPSGTVEARVSQSSDDAEERVSGGAVNLSSTDLELVRDGSNDQFVGMRFQNVTVPIGATITSAYLEFEVDETVDIDPTTLTISGVDADDPTTFTSATFDVSSRTQTTAEVAWEPPSWGATSAKHQSSDIASVVQEIVDRPGWSRGNAMAFVVEGSGRRVAESYDGEAGAAPLLVVDYTTVPSISVSGTPLSEFSSEPGVPSSEQSYAVTGWSLTEEIEVTAPADFEVAAASGGPFGASMVLPRSGGEVFVRMNTASEGSPSGVVSHSTAGATTVDVAVSGTVADIPVEWVAFNDMNTLGGDPNASHVTEYTYQESGTLKDYATGVVLPVVVSGSTSATLSRYGDGGPAASGTDAGAAFGGIVDLAGTDQLEEISDSATLTFSGLDPTETYAITLSANRANPSYDGQRWARVTIEGADAVVPASSSGVVENSARSVSFSIGDNTADGLVAKWVEISPGLDGAFSVTSEWDNGYGGTKGYAMAAYKIETYAPVSSPASVVASADNTMDLYVNGELVASSTNWMEATSFATDLAPGDVVGVHATDLDWSGGLLAEIEWDGSTFVSDTSWKVTASTPASGWAFRGFDDSGWDDATSYGSWGAVPWMDWMSGFPSPTDAQWIWTDQNDNTGDDDVYFRWVVGTPSAATDTVVASADNMMDVYVNGTLVGSSTNWMEAQTFFDNLSATDVIGVHATDIPEAFGSGGFIALIDWDGNTTVSDTSWKVTASTPGSDWADEGFNDDLWDDATSYGSWGVSPWMDWMTGFPSGSSAQWIWSDDRVGDDDVYFRKELGTPSAATDTIVASADNEMELFVNGVSVATSSDWLTATTVFADLAAEDVIAVHATDLDVGGLIGGFIAQIEWDGNTAVSDTSWKVTTSAPATGWNNKGFDDSSWDGASSSGVFGASPWMDWMSGFPSPTTAQWIWSADREADNDVYLRYTLPSSP